MDEDDYVTISPMRHDRYSVLIPLLRLAANVAVDFANTFNAYAIAAAQHSGQLEYDRKFKEVTN